MRPMIRISIHLMSDPADILLSEDEYELVMERDAGDRLMASVVIDGVRLPVAVDERTLDRWLEKERAEAVVP